MTSVYLRILETVHTAFCMHFVYDYIITGFGELLGFIDVKWCVCLSAAAFNVNLTAASLGNHGGIGVLG